MYALYFILWMIFFGSVTIESILFGLGIAAVIFLFTCVFLGWSLKSETRLYRRIGQMTVYLGVLIKDIFKANFTVIHMIFSVKGELEPVIVHFHSDLSTSSAKAVLADSITLTPGTITVFLRDNEYVVHCLDESLAPGLDTSACEKELARLEKE